jgi:hypothetical protein
MYYLNIYNSNFGGFELRRKTLLGTRSEMQALKGLWAEFQLVLVWCGLTCYNCEDSDVFHEFLDKTVHYYGGCSAYNFYDVSTIVWIDYWILNDPLPENWEYMYYNLEDIWMSFCISHIVFSTALCKHNSLETCWLEGCQTLLAFAFLKCSAV